MQNNIAQSSKKLRNFFFYFECSSSQICIFSSSTVNSFHKELLSIKCGWGDMVFIGER